MKNISIQIFLFFVSFVARGQQKSGEVNERYDSITLKKGDVLVYPFDLRKNGIYRFSILQQGIAVHYQLTRTDDKKLYESNYPNDIVGYENFEYAPVNDGKYKLEIKRFDDPENPDSGH